MHLGRIIPNKYKHRLEAKIRLNRAYWDNIMLLNMSISCTITYETQQQTNEKSLQKDIMTTIGTIYTRHITS